MSGPTQVQSGPFEVKIPLGGQVVEFRFRKPTAREWMDYEAARVAFGTATATGNCNAAIAREMFEKSEELCVRVVNSHSAQQLVDLHEEHLGLFFPLGSAIADVIDALRAGAGKASPPPGGA